MRTPSPKHVSKKRQQIIQALRREFRQSPPRLTPPVLKAYKAVVVLSGRVLMTPSGVTSQESENTSRIQRGVTLQQRIATAQSKKLGEQRRGKPLTLLLLIGTEEQLGDLRRLAKRHGAASHVDAIACGTIGDANTKTQMRVLSNYMKRREIRSCLLVTSQYHVPRTLRTADRYLSTHARFLVVGTGRARRVPERVIADEIDKILQYAAKGDLTLEPKRQIVSQSDPPSRSHPNRQTERGKRP